MLTPNDPPSPGEKIRFACPDCQAKVAAPSAFAGKKMRCPKCRNAVRVPEKAEAPPETPAPARPADIPPESLPELPDEGLLLKEDWLVFRCPSCNVTSKVHRDHFDKLVACGACNYEFSVGIG